MPPADINALWRSLIRIFPAVTLPIDFFFSPSMWRLLGSDLMPSLVQNRRSRRVASLLAGVSDDMLRAVADLARINVERTSEVFRLVAVGYVSLPIAAAALLSDAAPDVIRIALAEHLGSVIYGLAVLALTPAVYFCGLWRARQLRWAIEAYQTGAIQPL